MQYKSNVEDVPEPIKSPMYAFNERDPLHKLEERVDPEHMIRNANWGILLTSDEYLKFRKPFEREFILVGKNTT